MKAPIVTLLGVAIALVGAAPAFAQDDRPILEIGVQRLPEGLAPGNPQNQTNIAQRLTYSVFDDLIARAYWEGENGDGGRMVPSLATEWRNVSPTEWEVDIRTDVLFHNGEPMTTEDVAFSFSEQRMWGEDRIVLPGPNYFGNFTDVVVVDENTVRFTTSAPDPIFPARFASPLGKVVPKDYYLEVGIDAFNLAPIGTGPYKVQEIRQNEYIHMVANDDYWGGTPPAAEIYFREIPEEAARITGLLTGELDIIANVSPDQQQVIANSDSGILMPVIIDNSRVIGMRTTVPPTDDVNLRKALLWGADRQLIVDALWGGQTIVPHELNFPSHGDYYLVDREMAHYDPQKASDYLSASGYDGEELIFRLVDGYYSNYLQVAQVLQQQWRQLGINVTIEIKDSFAAAREGTYHMINLSNGMQIPDATHPMVNVYGANANRVIPDTPPFHWEPSTRFFELHDLLNATLDEDQRKAYFAEALAIVEDEVPQIELFMAVEYYGVSNHVNWTPYSFWPMDLGPRNLSFN